MTQAGPALLVQASIASPPGDDAAWFWSFECGENCNHAIPSADILFTYGKVDTSRSSYAFGAGVNGFFPYVDGYLQLQSGNSPFGVDARVGIPFTSWTEHEVYARLDTRLSRRTTLLWNPALFYHTGNSPNGENPGSFIGLVQGVGLRFDGAPVTPSVAVVLGRSAHRVGGISSTFGPSWNVFATAAVSWNLHDSSR